MRSKTSTQMQSRVLGIDPGFDRIGIAILEGETLLYSECIKTDRKLLHPKRLVQIGTRLKKILDKWEPHVLAIENLFFNQNTTNALKVSEARGVILYEAASAGLQVFEYSPQAVKIAVTSYGKADKGQIASMVRKLVALPSKKMLDDELDAIALCITHIVSHHNIKG